MPQDDGEHIGREFGTLRVRVRRFELNGPGPNQQWSSARTRSGVDKGALFCSNPVL